MMMIEESTKSLIEKRRFRRLQLPITVKSALGGDYHCRVLDVSEQGLRIASNRALPKGESINLDLYLVDGDPFPIRLVAKSVWSTSENEKPVIQGLDLSASHRRNLDVLKRHLLSAGSRFQL